MSLRGRALIPFAVLLSLVAACDAEPPNAPSFLADRTVVTAAPLGGPLLLLTADERRLFNRGKVVFQTDFTPRTGLGPFFNNTSCSQCHEAPVVGGVGEELETHATAFHSGVCDELSRYGGAGFEDSVTPALHAALGIGRDSVPAAATATAHRTTPSVLGFGLL